MTAVNQVYKCPICGNVVVVVHSGTGTPICCGQPMKLQQENTVDASKEKHVPVIEQADGKVTVKVGSVAHPMEEKHYIEWIELTADGVVYRKFLKPGDAPEAVFWYSGQGDLYARAFCNIHGLWKS
jgi:superoxide reductase